MADVPVYLFTGFLEAGKTKFIQETLEDERFNKGEKTLLLVCEEGEEEYDPSTFAGKNVNIELISDPSELKAEKLTKLLKAGRCERVVVEYNGMWTLNDFYNAMPRNWLVAQEFFFADAGTILTYAQNMRNLVADKLASCELVVFNRFPAGADKLPYHQLVRTFSRRTDIAYEAADGSVTYDDIEDPLPFDVNAPVITVGDDAYALWYRDMGENSAQYQGKTVEFKAMAVVKRGLDKGEFLVGRNVMTCCVQDMQFAGLICRTLTEVPANKSWVTVKAKISIVKHPAYGREGPVLQALSITPAQAPEQEIATFY